MKRTFFLSLALFSFAFTLVGAPSPTPAPKKSSGQTEKKDGAAKAAPRDVAKSANGWNYVKGEWIHPDGYKYVNGKVLRTTARAGRPLPQPPGKLALENPEKLPPPAPPSTADAAKKAASDKGAQKARNLAPLPAPQTGSHF